MKIFLTICFAFVFLPTLLLGQELTYDVVKGKKNLGEMTISRAIEGDVEEIKIKSDVTYKIIFSLTIKYNMYEKFRNGKLVWGNAHSTLAGKTQKKSKIEKKGDKLELTLNGVATKLDKQVPYSISQIYFDEPKDGQEVFSQQFAQFLTFKKVADHKYLLASPDGDNYYTYKNGICVDVRVIRDFARFNFVLQK